MRPITTPHLRAGEPEKVHYIGDSIARRHGVWIVPVACGKPSVATTLTTRQLTSVRCPDCIAVATPKESHR